MGEIPFQPKGNEKKNPLAALQSATAKAAEAVTNAVTGTTPRQRAQQERLRRVQGRLDQELADTTNATVTEMADTFDKPIASEDDLRRLEEQMRQGERPK